MCCVLVLLYKHQHIDQQHTTHASPTTNPRLTPASIPHVMTGTPHPRIDHHLTIPADVNPGTLARALLVLEAGIRFRDGHGQPTPTLDDGAA